MGFDVKVFGFLLFFLFSGGLLFHWGQKEALPWEENATKEKLIWHKEMGTNPESISESFLGTDPNVDQGASMDPQLP